VTIHSDNPFLDPTPDQARRLRGRLGGAVTLWTSGSGGKRAGLTVSSLMIATGEPANVLGLLDPDSDLAVALSVALSVDARTEHGSGRAVVQLLQWRHRGLAEMFAGAAPAPGGMFAQAEFVQTPWGPRLADATTWLGVSLADAREVGWSKLVTGTIDHLEIGDEDDPLVHRRGRYEHPAG
jgi:flavin reductase (DIM6/NTAB) family NADH-FMN oxidoreductase RutF